MVDDPKPGTFVFGFRPGVALARGMGTLCFDDDRLVPVVERGEMLVAAPADVSAGSYAYGRVSDGVVVTESDCSAKKLIGWWVTARGVDGLAKLCVDLHWAQIAETLGTEDGDDRSDT